MLDAAPDRVPDALAPHRWSAWYGPAASAAAAAASLAVYHRLPAEVVTHWGTDGVPDGWSPRPVGAFALPAAMLFTWALLRAAPVLDPRRAHYAKFGDARALIVNATLTLLLVVHGAVLAAALGRPVPMTRVAAAGVGLLLVAVGNVLPRVRSNFFLGVRTPWTLSSEAVWARTHRLAGHVFAGAGVVIASGALLFSPPVFGALLAAVTLTAVAVPTVYSYLAWVRESRRDPRHGR